MGSLTNLVNRANHNFILFESTEYEHVMRLIMLEDTSCSVALTKL